MTMRLNLVFGLFIIAFIVVLAKLFYLQVGLFENLSSLAEKQLVSSYPVKASRGRIFTIKNEPLVLNQKSYLVYARPSEIEDKDKVINKLSKILSMEESTLSGMLKKTKLPWIQIKDKVDLENVNKIKAEEVKGIGFIDGEKRYYPEGSMAAHLLGFVGKNSKGEDQGYFGLEGYYDEQLKGRDGRMEQERDPQGNPIFLKDIIKTPAENGRDLYLTIDKSLQYIAESKLEQGVKKFEAKGGSVVMMDPATGEILAMASYPSYDPGLYWDYDSSLYSNPVSAGSYEPGSTFKVLVMAAALNEKKIKSDTKFEENGPIDIGGYSIQTWDKKYRGEIEPKQILIYSSNVGMVNIERMMGDDELLQYINNLGFGKKTNIDLQDEAVSILRPKEDWKEIDFATASFGQGIAVTPLQMVRAVGAIANNGILMKPMLVKKIKYQKDREIVIKPKKEKEIFRKETASVITEMMVSAIDEGETKNIKPKGYRVAGKTGTAQIAIAGHYDKEKTIASFVGFAPVDNPKFVMLVTIVQPTVSSWGSETAAPVFFSIAKEAFSYFGLPPG